VTEDQKKKVPEAEPPCEEAGKDTPDQASDSAARQEGAQDAAQDAPEKKDPILEELQALKASLADQEDKFLRLAAEYSNFRNRTQKEKENIYADAKADTVKALLPVYDNLERALQQETADEAYKKGVEMTMTGLKKIFEELGVTEIDAAGAPFDPKIHNAVMHIEDEALGENTVAEVFQAGFRLGDKVIRFAMVKVAN